jgi:hypothetical protein
VLPSNRKIAARVCSTGTTARRIDKGRITNAYGSRHSEEDGVVYDKRDQLERIASRLLPGERIEAVYDGNGRLSGYIGIITKRLTVADHNNITSIPCPRITSITADGGWLSSKLIVHVGGRGEIKIEVNDGKKALHAHSLMLQHILA